MLFLVWHLMLYEGSGFSSGKKLDKDMGREFRMGSIGVVQKGSE